MSGIGMLTPMIANTPEVDPEILVGLMAEFCRAGGRPTLSEWVKMTPDEQSALVAARDMVFTETLEKLAAAVTPDPIAAVDVLAGELTT